MVQWPLPDCSQLSHGSIKLFIMPVREIIRAGRVPVHVYTADVEETARQQLVNLSRLPIIHHHVAAMPDVHAGIGATVGTVIATDRAIIPAAVGVDIGCGMVAACTSLTGDDIDEARLRRIYDAILRDVPVGHAQHRDAGAADEHVRALAEGAKHLAARHSALFRKFPRANNWATQLGTLGGGNHFIEICLDERNRVWLMLHSGSRGVGNAIGTYFIELARQDMQQHLSALPDRDLAYFAEGARHFTDYVNAVDWAQDYAARNRLAMVDLVLAAMRRHLPAFEVTDEVVNCHHNYVARERHYGKSVYVTRKGAIRAGAGEPGIIPGSMGTRSYIVRGCGAADSFESCAHGAGRRMSRAAAGKRYTAADVARQTEGVVCRKDRGVVDEIPAAYKDIDQVMEDQRDLVAVVHTLKQVVCVKG